MIASIDLTTSPLISFVCESACSASVRTARSTASLASSVLGLNSFFRSESKSPASTAPSACVASCWGFGSAMSVLRSGHYRQSGRLFLRILRGRQGLEQRRILQQLTDEVLGPALAIHIRNEIRELLAGLEQLVERVDLAGDCRRREVVHALEGQLHAEVAFAGERVRHLEGGARLERLHPAVEVVDVDVEELPVGHGRQRFGRLARQVRQDPHHERQLYFLLGAV